MQLVCMIPFPLLSFTDEVLDNVGGREAYSFTDGFSGYHQVRIAEEDRKKNLCDRMGVFCIYCYSIRVEERTRGVFQNCRRSI
nr:hypothetical protein Q903MT_gene2272 [Picea sitchensis]